MGQRRYSLFGMGPSHAVFFERHLAVQAEGRFLNASDHALYREDREFTEKSSQGEFV